MNCSVFDLDTDYQLSIFLLAVSEAVISRIGNTTFVPLASAQALDGVICTVANYNKSALREYR
jgi:hypothetical protein